MASIQSLGLNLTKLVPITSRFALPFGVYYSLLSLRVFAARISTRHYLGINLPEEASNKSKPQQTLLDGSPYPSGLELAVRAHSNFNENVPLAFIFLMAAELNGGDERVLGAVMGLLLTLRILHVEVGLNSPGTAGWGRPVGYLGSLAVLVGLGGYAGWLGWN
ncbi:hypothetical protein PVAG01_08091 [Phlyctema vagabunda]|uniref:MAPEG family protein n=1 Tax=Phlyctema vagabunda TaxID=108571 RepID=A0ABR4P8F3_9HELO